MIVRTAVPQDTESILALEQECMPHPWDIKDIAALTEDDKKIAIAAEEDGVLIGYVGASFIFDEAEIGNICVTSSRRRQGVAGVLFERLYKELQSKGVKTIFLEVERSNTGAIALYERQGFTMYNERKDYYGAGRDALLYRKDI